MEHEEHHSSANGAGYEVEDASVREIVLTGIGLAVGTILVCVAVLGLFKVLIKTAPVRPMPVEYAAPRTLPPNPRLQDKPWQELEAVRQREDDLLNGYGWVDKDKGIVRIPIDRAMDLVIAHGLPVRSAPAPGAAANQQAPANVPRQATGFPVRKEKRGNPSR